MEFNRTNQLWHMELRDGNVILCGLGLVENEFVLDTVENINNNLPPNERVSTFDIKEDMNIRYTYYPGMIIDGYYTVDNMSNLTNKDGSEVLDERLYIKGYKPYPNPPQNIGYTTVIIPKSDVVRTFYTTIDFEGIEKKRQESRNKLMEKTRKGLENISVSQHHINRLEQYRKISQGCGRKNISEIHEMDMGWEGVTKGYTYESDGDKYTVFYGKGSKTYLIISDSSSEPWECEHDDLYRY